MKLRPIKLKSGKVITFTLAEDTENINRGWVVDKILAFYNNEEVGYLKISYVPKAKADLYYSNIFQYASNLEGSWFIHPDYINVPMEQWDLEYLRKYISSNSCWSAYRKLFTDIEEMDQKTILKNLKVFIKKDPKFKRYQQKFEEFKAFHIDHPLVDYIRVYGPEDEFSDKLKGITRTLYMRGEGVGFALYLAGARYLKTKGLHLYASGLQSDSAKIAWAKLEKLGRVIHDGNRKYIKV